MEVNIYDSREAMGRAAAEAVAAKITEMLASKRFVNIVSEEGGKGKTIKGESGVKLPASLKSGRFDPLIIRSR